MLLALVWLAFAAALGWSTWGPIHLSDEAGYLTKAAFLSGHVVDAASSYHAGYSLLLAPVFAVTTDLQQVWAYVIALNAALWAAMLGLAWHLAKVFTKHTPSLRSPWGVAAAVLGLALYPSWAVMVGYAFPSLLTAALQMLCVVLLWAVARSRWPWLLGFSVCVGFGYWVHPTGLAMMAASALVLPFALPRRRRWAGLAQHVLVLLVMTLAYAAWLHPHINQAMTPAGQTLYTHYHKAHPLALLDPATAGLTLLRTFGQLAYLGVASLGLVWVAALAVLGTGAGLRGRLAPQRWRAVQRSPLLLLGAYALLSVAGVALMSSAMFQVILPHGGVTGVQHWHYGRYVDAVMAPLLVLGVLILAGPGRAHHQPARRLWLIGGALLLAGLALQWGATTRGANVALMTPAFWPQYQLPGHSYGVWYALGALGVVATLRLPLRWMGAPVLALALLAIHQQHLGRQTSLSWLHLQPSGLVGLIRASHAPGSCVGIDRPGPPDHRQWTDTRWDYLALHLLDMRYQRMTAETWLTQCRGPYLTRHPETLLTNPGVVPLALEVHTGIYLLDHAGAPLLQHLRGNLTDTKGWPGLQALGPLKQYLGNQLQYPIELGQSNTAAAALMLTHGWHTLEASHVWSQARASLWLPSPPACQQQACEAVLQFMVFGASPERPVPVHWRHRTTGERHTVTATSGQAMEARIPLPTGAQAHELALQVPGASSPARMGESPDERVLGVGLRSVNVVSTKP